MKQGWGAIPNTPLNGPLHSNELKGGSMSNLFKLRLLLSLFLFLFWSALAQAEDIAIIVNPNLKMNSISEEDLKAVYLGKIQFDAGRRLKPVDQKEMGDIRRLFLGEIMRMSKTDYTKHWMHLVFLEGTNPPILRENSQAVIDTVRDSEGGVGYVWASEAANAKGVKTVLTIHIDKMKGK